MKNLKLILIIISFLLTNNHLFGHIGQKTIYFRNRTKETGNPQDLTLTLSTIPSGIGGPARNNKIKNFAIPYNNPDEWYKYILEEIDEKAVSLLIQAENASLGYNKPSDILWSPVYTPSQKPIFPYAKAPIENSKHYIISWDDTLENKLRIDY